MEVKVAWASADGNWQHNIYNSRLTNITSQATNSSTARAVQHQGNPTIPASAQVASVEVCGAGRPHRFPLPAVHVQGAILSASHVQIHHLKGLPKFSNFQEFGNLHGLIHLRKSSYSKIWQAPVQLRVESQLFLHMTCHFDGSKLHSTPSPGSVSPQISPMKTWIRTWGQPPTCWKHAGGMKSGLAAKARRCCSFNASSQVRSSETENSDSSTWAHGGGHFSWQRPLLKKCLVQMELQRKTKKTFPLSPSIPKLSHRLQTPKPRAPPPSAFSLRRIAVQCPGPAPGSRGRSPVAPPRRRRPRGPRGPRAPRPCRRTPRRTWRFHCGEPQTKAGFSGDSLVLILRGVTGVAEC